MRLFVAVWPPADVVERLAALPRPDVPGLRWTSPAQWHVTLRFLGTVAEPADARAALAAVEWNAPVTATAGPTLGRFGRRILHLPVGGLDGLAGAITAATAAVGEPPEARPFRGHITLARARDRRLPLELDLAGLAATPFAAEWPVTEVTLVQSVLGGGPARYEVMAAVPVARG